MIDGKAISRLGAVAIALSLIVVSAASGEGVASSRMMSEYTGSEKCGQCHQIQYKGWVRTFHSTVVQDAKKNPAAILADMNAPDLPFKTEDICYTIGGHWDQRYLTKIGNDYFILPRLWSIQSRKWRPYSTYGWQKRPYTRYCIGCHAVGYDPTTKEVAEHAVGCESCHGPGRRHAAHPETSNIINPRRLTRDRADQVCAACHVRGKDTTGEYFFPIGFQPGMDLAKFLVPLDRAPGEDNAYAIHRLWFKWQSDREAQARSRCEVCGIHQNALPKGEAVSVDALCLSCHEYGEKLAQHTHHKAGTRIGCNDCHQQKDPEMNEDKDTNVHSYGFFLIHPQGCWDKQIYKRCGACHADKTEKWAYDIFTTWQRPVIVDH